MMNNLNSAPGWVAKLAGDNPHRDHWDRILTQGFDPWLETIPMADKSMWVLRSTRFENAVEAVDVRGIAEPIIEQLNGAQNVLGSLEPLRFAGVGKVEENRGFSAYVFATANIRAMAAVGLMTVEVRDSDGNLVPPPPPHASETQRWVQAAEDDDDIADILQYASRTDSWYDIYKAMELAKRLAGGKDKLDVLLGDSAKKCENMRVTANFYRHARTHRPDVLTTLEEAQSLLAFVVRTVLGARIP